MIGVLVVLGLSKMSWRSFGHVPLAARSLLVAPIVVVFIASAIALPRRRLLTTGIMLGAATLLIHLAAHR
ncbi:MAG: hypothetical protein M3081_13870 [Gemmatimonadota bacterium]|nr:hypothetical protein [Gemmatimonadota bacterium]